MAIAVVPMPGDVACGLLPNGPTVSGGYDRVKDPRAATLPSSATMVTGPLNLLAAFVWTVTVVEAAVDGERDKVLDPKAQFILMGTPRTWSTGPKQLSLAVELKFHQRRRDSGHSGRSTHNRSCR